MTAIGITGGIGSGKSTVAMLLQTFGIPVYAADTESRRLTAASPRIRQQLTALLGPAVYDASGLNRRLMASLIFSDARLLRQVNAIIHPEVARHFRAWTRQHADRRHVALESAILFESGFHENVDICLTVCAPRPLRIRRVMERDGISEAEVLQRISHQLPDEIKIERSDCVIINDERHSLIAQTEQFIRQISDKKR
jgi:dephospho-CoA kinase